MVLSGNMHQLFGDLKRFFRAPDTAIDNLAYRLHYRLSVALLMAACIVVSGNQFFGDAMKCLAKGVPPKMLQMYCWTDTIFSLVNAWNRTVGQEVPYPGIEKTKEPDDESLKVYHTYYQTVPFALLLQAVLFYAPHFLWKQYEGGLVASLVAAITGPNRGKRQAMRIKAVAEYLKTGVTQPNGYFYYHLMTEALNLLNVLLQGWLMVAYLGDDYLTLGWDVINFGEWSWEVKLDPLIKIFPRAAKCVFHLFGPSNELQLIDAICLLPLNIINAKVYLFLWFWFVLLAGVSVLAPAYRLVMLLSVDIRFKITWSRHRSSAKVSRVKLAALIQKSSVGDWFLLDLLALNLDSFNFDRLIGALSQHTD